MNKKTLPFLLLAVVFTLVYSSCKKADEVKQTPANQAYFPLEKGRYVIYDVDSSIWDDTNCVKVTRLYQMRWTIADTFTDRMGRPSMRIDVSIRKHAEDNWQTPTDDAVLYATNNGQELEIAHSNFRFIKMVYPVSEGRTWEGNAYINTADADWAFFKGWTYRYTDVDLPFGTGDVTYQHTVSVIAVDETVNDPYAQPRNTASRAYSKEVFAPGVGMVYREYYRWTYDPNFVNNMDPNYADTRCLKGTGVIMRAVDHN